MARLWSCARSSRGRAVALFGFLSFVLPLSGSQPAPADNLPGAISPTIQTNGTVPGITPAALGAYSPASLAGMPPFNFSSIGACMAPQALGMANALFGSSKSDKAESVNASSIAGVCGSGVLPEFKNSCDTIQVDGVVSDDLVNKLSASLSRADRDLTCQYKKLSTVGSHLTCLDSQMQDLNRFLELSKARYTDVINQAKSNLSQIEAIEDSRKGQMDTIGKRLNGDESGSEGLRKVAQRAKDYITSQLPQKVLAITTQQRTVDKQRASLADLRVSEQARIAATCFRQDVTRPDFRCGRGAGDKAVSAYDFVLCRVQQNSYLGKNGQIEDNANRKALAGSNRSGLQSVLDAILNDMPIAQAMPGTNMLVPNANRVLTPDDINRLFGAQLRTFNVPGFNTYDIVMKTIQACYNQASNDIVVLEQKPGTLLYENNKTLKDLEDQQAAQIDTLLTESSEVYDTITKTLTGLSIPVDPRTCRASPPAQQIQCLNSLKSNMQNLLSGVGEVSPHIIDIPGTMPEHNIRMTCSGVNGCLAGYEGFYRSLDTEVKRVGAYKKKFINDSNTNINKITTQLQQQAQLQMKGLEDYRNQVNAMLAALNVDKSIDFKTRDPEKPTYNGGSDPSKGIMDAPQDMARFLGLPDLKGGSLFSEIKTATAKKRDEVSRDVSKAKTEENELTVLKSKCRRDQVKKAARDLDTAIADYKRAKCLGNSDQASQLPDLMRSIREIGKVSQANAILSSGDTINLERGFGNPTYSQVDDDQRKIDDIKKQLALMNQNDPGYGNLQDSLKVAQDDQKKYQAVDAAGCGSLVDGINDKAKNLGAIVGDAGMKKGANSAE